MALEHCTDLSFPEEEGDGAEDSEPPRLEGPAGATQGGATASPNQLSAPEPWELKLIAKAQGSVGKTRNDL